MQLQLKRTVMGGRPSWAGRCLALYLVQNKGPEVRHARTCHATELDFSAVLRARACVMQGCAAQANKMLGNADAMLARQARMFVTGIGGAATAPVAVMHVVGAVHVLSVDGCLRGLRIGTRQCAAGPLIIVIEVHAELPAIVLRMPHSAGQADRWNANTCIQLRNKGCPLLAPRHFGQRRGPSAGIARVRGVVRQNAAVVLVGRVNAVGMRGCVHSVLPPRGLHQGAKNWPNKTVMRPRKALQCRLVPGVLLMQRPLMWHARREFGLGWRCFVLKRILSVCMRVFWPWDHGAAQHVGREIDPGLMRMLLSP